MGKFLKVIVSIVLATLMIAVNIVSAVVPVSADNFILSTDTEQASNDAYTTLMAGIDISGWQTSVNWTNVKNSGVEFAMFRICSYSSATHTYVKDPMLDSHINGAKSQGIHIGAYFFSYAKSVQEVRNEANMVLDIIRQYPATFDFPIVFDAESTNIQGFAADACVAFREILEGAGYYVSIYANSNWFNNIITPASKIAGCDLWQAYYPWTTSSSGVEKYAGYTPSQAKSIDFNARKAINNNNQCVYMWQFTQKGTVSGIGSNCVDMNICSRNYPQRIRDLGLNGFATSHTHSYQAGNDTTHHYQICSCGHKINVVEHSYTAEYNENQHTLKCSCQYIKETANHKFEYVDEGNTHKQACVCGYEKPNSSAKHSYDKLESNEENHYYTCICGKVDSSNTSHKFDTGYDVDNHYDYCVDCQMVKEESREPHNYENLNSDDTGHWYECECGARHRVFPHTSETGKCEECGYHKHMYYYNSEGHWVICEECSIKGRVEKHFFDEVGCTICEYKKEADCEHEMVNSTCTKCGYHEHEYSYNEEGHTMICYCSKSTAVEEHTLNKKGKCKICGYDPNAVEDTGTETEPIVEDLDVDFDVDDDSAEGCNSSIGATATVLGTALIIGCGLAFRKKEE